MALPAGRVTFLMTDVERSTKLWEEHPETMGEAIRRHDELIADAVATHGGVLIRSKGEGDSSFSVFEQASAAVSAAAEIQRVMRHEPWPDATEIKVRAAVNTGEAELRENDYYGIEPNRCARLRAVAHGGQTICSLATFEAVAGRLAAPLSLRDLGLHRLRDLSRAERIFQICRPDAPDDFPPLRSLPVRNNLPPQRTSFVGRYEDLVGVRKHLEVDRLLTLLGPGGSGKTRLAVEAAGEALETFPDGVFFADLSPVSDPEVVAGVVASAVGFSRMALGTGSGRPAPELLDFLSTRRALLVVDNCEHLIDAAASLVDEILARCPQVSVLATSREALQIEGEQVYPVAPLSVPEDDLPEASDAVRLFCERALSVRPSFTLTPQNADDIAEICRRLDGIPLAIELAAAQIAHLAPRQLLDRLSDRLQLFAGGRRRAERQRTLQGALDWSHDLLSDAERTALRRLSVFPGTFSLDAASAVCDLPVLDVIGSLVGKSLVMSDHRAEAETQYRLLETVRIYAQTKFDEVAENDAVRDRFRDHLVAWAEAIPEELTYLDPDGRIVREAHNLRAALAWSQEQGRCDLVARLASTMNRLWIADVREGRRWIASGLEAVDDLEPAHRVRVLAVAAHTAVLAIEAFDGVLATRAVEAAQGQPPGLWPSLAHGLLCLNRGIRYLFSRDPVLAEEVEDLGRKAVDLAAGPVGRGLAWFWLAQARVLLDDLDGAIEGFKNGSEESSPGADMAFACHGLLAGTLHIAGRHDEALAAAEHVLQRARGPSAGLWAWALYCSLPYALELGRLGRHAQATDFVRDLFDEGGVPRTPGVMTSVVIVLGALAALRGDVEAANVLLEFAGAAIITSGVRTPVDIALYAHYLKRVRPGLGAASVDAFRERGQSMSLDEALAYGLRAS